MATPTMSQWSANTKTSEATMLATFWKMATHMGMRVDCMPTDQPVRP